MENKKIKILAIDDNQDNLISIIALIKEAFPDALTFSALNGKKGVEIACAEDPDVILLDIIMPGMDGFEVCKKLKADKKLNDIPVVFVTAVKDNKESRIRALECGAEAFLTKPIDECELIAQIRAMVKIKFSCIKKRDEKEKLEQLVKERTLSLQNELKERKLAEKELIKSREMLNSIEKAAKIGGWEFDVETMTQTWTEEIFRILEIDLTDEAPKVPEGIDFISPEFQPMAMLGIQRAIEFGEPYDQEWEVITAKGNKLWVHAIATPYQENGKTKSIAGSFQDITQRKLVEKKLIESDTNYRYLFDQSPVGSVIVDFNEHFIKCNTAFCSFLGYSESELLGKTITEITHPEDIDIGISEMKQMVEGKIKTASAEKRYIHKNGSILWGKIVISLVRDTTNKPLYFLPIIQDISERKQAEKLFQDIIDKNPLSIQIVDKKGCTLHGNPSYVKLFGMMPPPEFSIFTDLKSKSPELEKLILLAISGEVVRLPDLYYNPHDVSPDFPDNPLWISALIFPLNDISGKPERFIFMHENITESKQAEEALIESEEKFSKSFFNSPDSIIINRLDDGKIVTVNNGFRKIMGYEEAEVIGKTTTELNFYKKPEERNAIISALKTTRQVTDIECWFITKHGEEILGLLSAAIIDINGVKHIMSTSRDITERKKMEQELIIAKDRAEESDRLKSSFLANMSHEIRTPMNGILGFANLLKEPDLSGEEQHKYINIIEHSGKRMLNIINDIVDVSKIEAGLMKVNIMESNINEQIEYIYTFFKPEVEAKGLKLSFKNSLLSIEAFIKTDSEKLFAILTNLVKNAIKYTNKGSIIFGCDKKDEILEFFVKDTGIGIPKDRQKAIFERFIQADIEDKKARQGAGLGLTITKSYVEMLGGEIWVESEEGIGSTFYFTLPYHVDLKVKSTIKNNVAVAETENSNNPEVRKLKVLIVEDDEPSEILIKIMVKTFSREILKARTGQEAIETCRNHPDIDLILMDIQLPEMDGYEASREIRQFNKKVVIVAQTAYALSGDKEKSMEAGCNDYITKPIKKELLLEKIRKLFSKI